MKFLVVLSALVLAVTAVGLACGPEQKYCYDQHLTCAQAEVVRRQQEAGQVVPDAASVSDAGTTVVGGE